MGLNVTYGGDPIPKSPFAVAVAPSLDLSKVKVAGIGDGKLSLYLSCLSVNLRVTNESCFDISDWM